MKLRYGHALLASAALASAPALAGGQQHGASSESEQSAPQAQANPSPEVVKQAQEKLAAEGYNPGTPDGQFSQKTQEAVMAFQNAQGLEASGRLDGQTLAALDIDASEPSSAAGGT